MQLTDGVKYETIVYVFRDDEVLLFEKKRKFLIGNFVPPGGKLDAKDNGSFSACAVRELWEETGKGINALEIVAIGEILFDNSKRDFGKGIGQEPNHKVYFFEATKYKGEMRETEEGRPLWVKWSEVEKLKMPPGDRVFHKWVRERNGRYFEGQVMNTQDGVDEKGTWVRYK